MKIVHIYWGLSYGGIETMLVNIINEQVSAGAKVCMMLINDLYADELIAKISPEVEIIYIGRKPGDKSLSFINRINRQLDIARPDIIHLHHTATSNFIARRWRKRMCCTVHDIPHGAKGADFRCINIFQWMLRPRLNNVRAAQLIPQIFAISASVADGLWTNYSIKSDVVYNGIQTEIFKRRAPITPEDRFKIIQVSRLDHRKKGQDLLIEALAILSGQGFDDFHVTFIGSGESLDTLSKLAESLKLSDRIVFAGAKEQKYIAEHLSDYDLFVQPSRKEGFGLTVAEAMAADLPVLVSAGQGPEEITKGDTFGYTFTSDNAADLALKIRQIRENYAEALEKAAQARDEVYRNYSVKNTAATYLRHYSKIIQTLDEKH
ncbi:MAG: glycosyltransferase family 4 protein [Muribaculaceae bacterium]|nr:glycosyltransferase family 4 protein [Muribaculaceae bacterium]